MKRLFAILTVIFGLAVSVSAQDFFNLTAEEVRIDSVLPYFHFEKDLGECYADSVYEVSIEYPEFIDMAEADVLRYQEISGEPLAAMPVVRQHIGVAQKRGRLDVSLSLITI